MNIFSFELFSVLFTIMIIVKFKLNQKFILLLLKGVKIFLPPTDGDNELIKQLKKEKNNPQSQKAEALVRTCEVNEYVNCIKDDNYTEADVIVFFYLTTLLNLLIIELGKFSEIYYKQADADADVVKINDPNGNTVNISASFALITVIYLIYTMFRSNFKMGYKSYDAKLFYSLHVGCFIFSMIFLSYFENILPIDYENICEIINERIDRISNKASENSEPKSISNMNFKLCSKPILKFLYSIVFSFVISLMYRSSTNLAEFENILLNLSSKNEKNEKRVFNVGSISTIIKVKQLLNIFILFLLIDPLLKNLLVENTFVSDLIYHVLLLFPLIFIEMIFGFYCTKYYSELFLESNYYDMVTYCDNPGSESLQFLRKKMSKVNSIFWEIFIRIFYMNFMALLLFILFINRANAFSHFGDKDFKFRSNFFDSLVYFWILGIFLSKSVFYNGYMYYLKNYNKSKTSFTI